MRASELREKSEVELEDLEHELSEELFKLRMKHFTGQLQQVALLKTKRRDIARVKTILREKERAAFAAEENE